MSFAQVEFALHLHFPLSTKPVDKLRSEHKMHASAALFVTDEVLSHSHAYSLLTIPASLAFVTHLHTLLSYPFVYGPHLRQLSCVSYFP